MQNMVSLLNKSMYCLTDPLTTSNCYVIIGRESCLVIDPNRYDPLDQLFQKCNKRPSVVLLTHEHCDHVAGLNQLRSTYPVTVVCSESCDTGIQNTRRNMSRVMELYLYYKHGEKEVIPYAPFVCRPAEVTFADQYVLAFEDIILRLEALPGHTAGSSIITCEAAGESPVIFTGDYLLPDEKVVTRLPGGNTEDYRQYAMRRLAEIPDGVLIYPGHGQPFRMNDEVRRYHEL